MIRKYEAMRLMTFCIFILSFPLMGGTYSFSENIDPYSNEYVTDQPALWYFLDNEQSVDVNHIRYVIGDHVPDLYSIGPVDSSCFETSNMPCYWIVAMNYYKHKSGSYVPVDSNLIEPARLQFWRPTKDNDVELVQEFQLEYGFVQDVGWLKKNCDYALLYVITDAFFLGSLACFSYNPVLDQFDIISEERFYDLIWPIKSVKGYGPLFASWGFPHGNQPIIESSLYLITLNHRGYYREFQLPLTSIFTENEFDAITDAEDFASVISYRIKWKTDWIVDLVPFYQYFDDNHIKYNASGNPYYSFTEGWQLVKN